MRNLGALLAGAGGVAAYVLTAQSTAACITDADCGAGYICETFEFETCNDRNMACEEGEDCKPVECVPTTEIYSSCSRAPCEVDADCGDSMIRSSL